VAAVTQTKADEYRRRAQECFELARSLSAGAQRDLWLDMAQTWLRLAQEREAADLPPIVPDQACPTFQQQQQVQPEDDEEHKR
jgi:hypothetical protein